MLTREPALRFNRRANVATEPVLIANERRYNRPSESLYGQLILIVIFALVVLMRLLR